MYLLALLGTCTVTMTDFPTLSYTSPCEITIPLWVEPSRLSHYYYPPLTAPWFSYCLKEYRKGLLHMAVSQKRIMIQNVNICLFTLLNSLNDAQTTRKYVCM